MASTSKLGATGLYVDVEGVYMKGRNEIAIRDVNWSGNATHTRPITAYDQINKYTNDGRSKYKALVFALNGTVRGGHVVTASVTFASKHNVNDDFSPEFPTGYPSDPANMDAEYGRARSYERMRHRGLGRRPAPVADRGRARLRVRDRASRGPSVSATTTTPTGRRATAPPASTASARTARATAVSTCRLSKAFNFSGFGFEVLAEAFNLLNTVNYDVKSIDNAEFTAGPTIANPAAAVQGEPELRQLLRDASVARVPARRAR